MSILKKLQCLLPSRRRAEERDMREELDALREIAGPRELGNLTLAAEDAREAWTWMWLERLGQDLRYALRTMGHNKAFTTLAVLSLALGIGANTAIYSFVEAILLRQLPVSDPESLVLMRWQAKEYASVATVTTTSTGGGYREAAGTRIGSNFPYQALEVLQGNPDVLSSAFGYFVENRLSVTVDASTEGVRSQYVTGDYFRGMGVQAAAGRLILPYDDSADPAVAVLSEPFSRRRFGEPEAAVGRTIRINDKPFVVIGVTPAGFFGAEPGTVPDLYLPFRAEELVAATASGRAWAEEKRTDRNHYWIEIMGRLAPGVDLVQAQAVLAPQFHRFVESSATTQQMRADLPQLRVERGSTGLDTLRRRYSQPLYVLVATVGLILLIACANVANLLLARATARRREIAVRLSIGAGRIRVIRQLLTESVLLSSLGGLFGLAFGWWGIRVLTSLLANGRDNFTLHAALNWTVLAATFFVSVVTGLLFGLVPGIQATRVDVVNALKAIRAGSPSVSRRGAGRSGLSHTLVVGQLALSLVLLVAAGLFGGTLRNLHSIPLGFSREDILLFTIAPTTVVNDGAVTMRIYSDLQTRLRETPGVLAVSLSSRPLPAGGGTIAPVRLADSAADPRRLPARAGLLTVGPSFFETMQIPLAAGRDFTAADVSSAAAVAIVNERLVRALGLANPIGARITRGGGGPQKPLEIIGVVRDALFLKLKDEMAPMVYEPYRSTAPPYQMTYEVRTAGLARGISTAVRQIVRDVDSRLAVFDMKTQTMHIDQAIAQEITLARLCIAFAILALITACVGLYATVSFNVTRRTGEIGIRMALGAQRGAIIWLVTRSVLTLELIGVAIGVPLVLATSRYAESLLYGLKPNDPMTVAAAAAVLMLAGLVASFTPARRAAALDPMRAVQHE